MAIDCCKSYVGKQIIGLLPGGAEECLYVLAINAEDYGSNFFGDWTIDGEIFSDYLAANFDGSIIYQNSIGYESCFVYYIGTQPTTINVTTEFATIPFTIRKVTDFEGGSCDYVCYQASFDYGYQWRFIDYFSSGNVLPEQLGLAISIEDDVTLYNELISFLGPQITVSSVWNGSQYVVTINNAFNLGGFRLGDGAPVYTAFTALPCEIVPPEPVPFYLLDVYSGAGAAYSVRKLSSSYTGAALRVRRSSDNAEQDIGFSGLGLDTNALTSFVGANNAFVTTWYDQSGNNSNMINTTASQQPSIVTSGSVITRNGIISLFFNSSNSNKLTSSYGLSNGPISTIGVLSLSGTNSFAFIQNKFFAIGTIDNINWGYLSGAAVTAIVTTIPSLAQYTTGALSVSSNASYLIYGNWNGNVNVVKHRSNGIAAANSPISGSTIRKDDTASQTYLIGYATELIVYPSDQASNVAGMETNINGYYNIYP